MNHNKPTTRLGLDTCEGMYEKLKYEAKRLEEGWSVYDSFNFVITADHLYNDWIKECGSQKCKVKKSSLPEDAQHVMQAIIDLSNGCKHWQMRKSWSVEHQVITKAPERGINDWYAYLVSGPMIYIEFGGYKISMMELRDLVLGYFEWIFSELEDRFPLELTHQLETYKVGIENESQSFPQRVVAPTT